MINLLFRSILVLALLFGLLFGVGMATLTYFDAPPLWGLVIALGVLLLQYLLGPWILQLIYKIQWLDLAVVDPDLDDFVRRVCAEKNMPVPRFGLIEDGNPNAMTFGHYPGDARLVVTRGILTLLDREEKEAVVAHELGHIIHWDFVVMTIAAAVPLILYILYRSLLRSGSRRSRKGDSGYAALVGLISFFAYVISQFIVLLLSRVREYYADQFSAEVTHNPDALSTALVKVAYGLAANPAGAKKDDTRMVAARAFGIFDHKVAQNLALAGAASGVVTAETMENAMKWDLWNPWAMFYELSSTHPLPAKRIRALEKMSQALGRQPRFSFRAEQPESYWDEFLVDLFFNYLPLLGLIGGAVAALLVFGLDQIWGSLGIVIFGLSLGWWIKRRFSYNPNLETPRTVKSLISEVEVSAVRSIPCTLQGQIIGRGVPGLFYSEDLVLQDQSGFIVVDYRQPLRLFEIIFGWFRAEKLIGKNGQVSGWYRRAPSPRLELRRITFSDGTKLTSYVYPLAQFFVYAGLVLGLALAALQFLGVI